MHETKLSNYVMIILPLHLRLNIKAVYGERIKILTPNQMLQSLPIVTATGLEPTTT